MATINMPKKDKAAEPDTARANQGRPPLARYRLQVDRQTKATFASLDEARSAENAVQAKMAETERQFQQYVGGFRALLERQLAELRALDGKRE
jgi:hypothetical protein